MNQGGDYFAGNGKFALFVLLGVISLNMLCCTGESTYGERINDEAFPPNHTKPFSRLLLRRFTLYVFTAQQ